MQNQERKRTERTEPKAPIKNNIPENNSKKFEMTVGVIGFIAMIYWARVEISEKIFSTNPVETPITQQIEEKRRQKNIKQKSHKQCSIFQNDKYRKISTSKNQKSILQCAL